MALLECAGLAFHTVDWLPKTYHPWAQKEFKAHSNESDSNSSQACMLTYGIFGHANHASPGNKRGCVRYDFFGHRCLVLQASLIHLACAIVQSKLE